MEILRSALVIAEMGSLTKAADRLGLTQPAITAQLKRLSQLVGGDVFDRTPLGSSATALGKLVLQHAKRILEANDQILMLNGDQPTHKNLRLGITTSYARDLYAKADRTLLSGLTIHIDKSAPIVKGLLDGYIDVACVFETRDFASDIAPFVVAEKKETAEWIKSPRGLDLKPGEPLPIVAWTGDDWMLPTLDRMGLTYRITTNTPDFYGKHLAVEAGMGFSALAASVVPETLAVAKDAFLPKLPPVKSLLCIRQDLQSKSAEAVVTTLSKLFFGGKVTFSKG
jgi:DNA-binding transcriptional LysR family regulator